MNVRRRTRLLAIGENNRTLWSELQLEGSGRFSVLLTGEINCKSLLTGDGDRKCCCTLELDGRWTDVASAKVSGCQRLLNNVMMY